MYFYIWDGRKGTSWRQIAKPRINGGLSPKDIMTMGVVVSINRPIHIWGLGCDESI